MSAAVAGAAYVIRPPTTPSSSRTSCAPSRTLPLMCSTGEVMPATLSGLGSSVLRVGLGEVERLPLGLFGISHGSTLPNGARDVRTPPKHASGPRWARNGP